MEDNIILIRITEKPIESSKATMPGAANITMQKEVQMQFTTENKCNTLNILFCVFIKAPPFTCIIQN